MLSIATIFHWCLAKIDVKRAFIQTGKARRDFYVIPPIESEQRGNYCLLLSAAYGLVNATAKWQERSDKLITSISLAQLIYVPQIFFKRNVVGQLMMITVKVVDDVLFSGEVSVVKAAINQIQMQYELGTVVFGPGSFFLFGLEIIQLEYFTIQAHADEKVERLLAYLITRPRRKQADKELNSVELGSFRSVNSSTG